MIRDFLISISWVLFIMALVWTVLKPTLASALALVATLCLVAFMIEGSDERWNF